MDKDLIREYGLEEQIKKMRMINEYTFITKPSLDEDDGDQQQPMPQGDPQQQQQPPMDGGQQQGGQQMSPMPRGGQEMPPMQQGSQVMGGAAPMDNGPVDGVGTDVEGGEEPTADGGMEGAEPMEGEDDEVIDVDDLTNSQTATEYKVDTLSSKVEKILNAVDLISTALSQNDQKLTDLKSEIENRNPTPEEKLNIRSQSSYPYSTTPKDYWNEVNADPTKNYNVTFDNNNPAEEGKKDDEKYDILAQDVDNLDLKKVSDSLDKMPSLDDYLGL